MDFLWIDAIKMDVATRQLHVVYISAVNKQIIRLSQRDRKCTVFDPMFPNNR